MFFLHLFLILGEFLYYSIKHFNLMYLEWFSFVSFFKFLHFIFNDTNY
jgi:hypothetical protein